MNLFWQFAYQRWAMIGLAVNVRTKQVLELTVTLGSQHQCPFKSECQGLVSSCQPEHAVQARAGSNQQNILAQAYSVGHISRSQIAAYLNEGRAAARPFSYCLLRRRGHALYLQRNELVVTVDARLYREIWRWV